VEGLEERDEYMQYIRNLDTAADEVVLGRRRGKRVVLAVGRPVLSTKFNTSILSILFCDIIIEDKTENPSCINFQYHRVAAVSKVFYSRARGPHIISKALSRA